MDGKKKRNIYFDNLKVLLIILVVFGHVIEQLRFSNGVLLGIYNFIYLFHMPLFIFCSGAFAKPDPVRGVKKYLIPYVIMQFLFGLFDVYICQEDGFHFLDSYYVLWYLLALVVWSISIFLFKTKQQPQRKSKQTGILLLSIGIGLLAGYVDWIGKTFSLSRIFVFFPFFILGYYCNREDYGKNIVNFIEDFRHQEVHKNHRIILKIIAFLVLGGAFVLVMLLGNSINTWALYGYTSYAFQGYTVRFRLLQYLAAVVLGLCVCLLVPEKKVIFPSLARNMMGLYLLHVPVIKLIEKTGVVEVLSCGSGCRATLLELGYGVTVTAGMVGVWLAVLKISGKRFNHG